MNVFISQILLNLKNKNLSDIDKILLSKLKDKSNYFIDNTATNIAKELYTNTTVINRFFKKCGFDSYTHFIYSWKSILLNDDIVVTQSVKSLTNDISINKSFFDQKYTYFIISRGASQVSSLYLSRQMLILGYNAIIIDEISLILNNSNAKLIIISQSGESIDLVTLIHSLKAQMQVEVLSITSKDSSIEKLSDYSITHSLKFSKIDKIQSEQQLHMLALINNLIEVLK